MEEIIARLFDPATLLVNMVLGMVINVVYFYLLQRVLPPRSKAQYWVVMLSVYVVLAFIKPIVPTDIRTPVYIGGTLLPVFLLQGTWLARVITVSLGWLALSVGEVAGVLVWSSVSGLGVVNNDVLLQNLPTFVLAFFGCDLVVLYLLLTGERFFVRKFVPCGLGEPETNPKRGRWSVAFGVFVVLQVMVVFETVGFGYQAQGWSPSSVVVAAVVLFVLVIVDLLILRLLKRTVTFVREEVRAEALEASIAAYLREAEDMQGLLDDTARLRHDVRNHRAVVELMCKRGEYAQAEAYLKAWE